MTTVKLTTPITHGDKTYTELTFRKPIVRDLIAAEIATKTAGDTARAAAIFAGMAGIPYPAMQELSFDDFARVTDEAGALMGNLQAATGSNP